MIHEGRVLSRGFRPKKSATPLVGLQELPGRDHSRSINAFNVLICSYCFCLCSFVCLLVGWLAGLFACWLVVVCCWRFVLNFYSFVHVPLVFLLIFEHPVFLWILRKSSLTPSWYITFVRKTKSSRGGTPSRIIASDWGVLMNHVKPKYST